jgi:hypothetical protein
MINNSTFASSAKASYNCYYHARFTVLQRALWHGNILLDTPDDRHDGLNAQARYVFPQPVGPVSTIF